jgi:hypothetical protein
MYPTGLDVLRRESIPRSLYPTSFGFSNENRSNVVINVSDRPWCFAARFDQIFVVQVSDDFSTGAKVLLNYLVIYMSLCIVCSKLFQLEGKC